MSAASETDSFHSKQNFASPQADEWQFEFAHDASGLMIQPEPEIADLVPVFLQNRRHDLVALENAISLGDMERIQKIAHMWKGICRPYGFVALESLSREIEKTACAGDHQRTKVLIDAVRVHLSKVQISAQQL